MGVDGNGHADYLADRRCTDFKTQMRTEDHKSQVLSMDVDESGHADYTTTRRYADFKTYTWIEDHKAQASCRKYVYKNRS